MKARFSCFWVWVSHCLDHICLVCSLLQVPFAVCAAFLHIIIWFDAACLPCSGYLTPEAPELKTACGTNEHPLFQDNTSFPCPPGPLVSLNVSLINVHHKCCFFFPKVFHFSCFAYYKYELLLPIISINSSSFINQHFGSKARRFLVFLLFTTLFSLLKWRNDEWYLINICVTAHYELFGLSEDGWCWGEPKHCFNQLTTYCS